MNRKDFSAWLGIPYRTMQEWELGRRAMLEYVLRLIAYKVQMEGPYNDSIVWYWNSF
ncbi:XRE family transcriptional regulator [Eubacteriales bacterium KG127]